MFRYALACSLAFFLGAPLNISHAQESSGPAESKPVTPAELASLAEKLAPSLAVVEMTLQYDKGDAPGSDFSAWRGSWDSRSSREFQNWDELIKEERPAERAAYILSPTRVVTSDPQLHPRFVREYKVRFGDQLVKATPVAYARDQQALFLELAEPLKNATPLVFDASLAPPYVSAAYRMRDDAWAVELGSASSGLFKAAGAPAFSDIENPLITTRDARPVGMSFNSEVDARGDWKGSPDTWNTVSADEMSKLLGNLESTISRGIVRVALRFRSPLQSTGADSYDSYSYYNRGNADDSITEWNGNALLIDPTTVVVLANFKPKVTARLEAISVYPGDSNPDAKPVNAKFSATLKDYGCFIAKLDEPMNDVLKISSAPVASLKHRLLLKAEIAVVGEIRTAYYWRERVHGYALGWRRQVYPIVAASRNAWNYGYDYSTDGDPQNFLFTTSGELAIAPVSQREKVAVQQQGWNSGGRTGEMIAVAYLTEAISQGASRHDPENRPLSEEEENRLAWLGVELQAMDPDLARMNKVVDQTSGGATGAVITYIYENSPAAKAELQVGDILLRIHAEDQPKPLEIELDAMADFSGMMDQIWENMDRMPEEYFDRMPKPWGSAENSVTRALTDVGFGTAFTLDYVRDGKVLSKDMKVEQGPAHFDAARKFKSEPAGLTVRDITFEVRRYFQLKSDDPGVIISKVEKGEKAAIAGIKPFEIITSVNDQPINSAAEFEKAIAAGGELRFSVKRKNVGRIVKIRLDPAGGETTGDSQETEDDLEPNGQQPANDPAGQP